MPKPYFAHAQVRIKGRLHGQETVNVLNFATNTQINDPLDLPAFFRQLATDVKDCVETTLAPAVTSDWKFEGCDVKQTAPQLGDIQDIAATPDVEGTLAPTSVSFAAVLMQIQTGGGGKSGKGRVFLPPPGEPQIAQSAIDGATEALFIQFAACLIAKFIQNATSPWRLGVLSRKKVNNVLPAIDDRFREATNLVIKTDLSSIRSRKKGSGN